MHSEPAVLSIDIGSTAVKVIAMTRTGDVLASASGHYPTQSPLPGWVEQDPESWWDAAAPAVRECMTQLGEASVAAVSFSGHMSAPVLVDRDGRPVLPSILIADTRSHEETRMLRSKYKDVFVKLTGNEPVDAFTVSKLLWIKNHHPEAMRRAATLLFPKDYIRYKMTGMLGTDQTDAGNSLLYDHGKNRWAIELIEELGLPSFIFPRVHSSHERVGFVNACAASLTGIAEGTPVVAGAADMACSQLGTGAVHTGTLAITLSTSAQVVMRVDAISASGIGQITYHPSALPNSMYAMGSVFTGGLGVEWAYKLLTGKKKLDPADYESINRLSEEMVDFPPGSSNLMYLPFLVGSGTPHFDSSDRAAWLGLSTGQSTELLMHSVLEGVSYNIRESMEVFEAGGHQVRAVHLGGGGSRNPVWSRMIGDVLGKDIALLNNRDASALGSAMLAGAGAGFYEMDKLPVRQNAPTSEPKPHSNERHQQYNGLYARYLKAYRAVKEVYRYGAGT